MNRFGLPAIVLVASVMDAGCGGKQSVASKSAAAYREAVAKGIPVGAGEHGGHTNDPASSGMPGMDQSAMPGMKQTATSGGPHDMSKMPGMQHGSTAGMGSMPGMQHGSMSGMDHSMVQHESMAGMKNMPAMEHGSMAGMGNMPGMAGMHHASTTTTTPVVLGAPTSSSAIVKLSPTSTLQEDQFDRPATIAPSTEPAHHDGGHS